MTKPPYRVPSMREIAELPWNGLTVVSTFSGCGGSSLGYKMAGFRVAWASEFIEPAQEVYRLNHPGTILDTRDIRTVKPGDILEATGLRERSQTEYAANPGGGPGSFSRSDPGDRLGFFVGSVGAAPAEPLPTIPLSNPLTLGASPASSDS